MTATIKGRITLAGTGEFVPFMFNPTEVQDGRTVNYPSAGVPGSSHPVPHYVNGGPRPISFELWLDGCRGWSVRGRPRNTLLGDTTPPGATRDISIQHEIDWYRSLTYAEDTVGRVMRSRKPPVVLLTYGSMYRATPCIVLGVSVTVQMFRSSDLAPIRATVAMSFQEKVDRTQLRQDVYLGGGR